MQMLSSRGPLARALSLPILVLALPGVARAQIDWASYSEDPSRLVAPANLGADDTEEKDYAWGDLDKDGWIDLVVVRKEPFTTQGRRKNVLLMNEGGVLTDRTAQYAEASDVGGDDGFNTPTNDRDVILWDVTGDGWLDVITAVTLTPGQPKHVSHPRVYVNLQDDVNGDWLGLRFEAGRTPQIKVNGSDYFPFFCGVGAGDVDGDDVADLYFADYDVAGFSDVNDRLFINDGTGTFADESTSRMSAAMLHSPFGTSAEIVDMNADGVNDVVKNTGLGQTAGNPLVAISYNDPGDEGDFNILHEPYQGQPYHVSTGDLNQDGKLDMVISDDGDDRYMLNQGNDPLGRVIWSPAHTFVVNDDGFGSNNDIVDIDQDGWEDAWIADVDVDIPGCGRRLHIYHNTGGVVGGFVTLKEESGGGSIGVTGMSGSDQTGTHDVAVFDIDNDGDMDMVLGRCSGTNVWTNDLGITDCNNNGVDDSEDISNGTSQDCDGNGIPDECDPDCDNDGTPDDCEADCNDNGTPDDCESFTDCNDNGVPDECDPDCDNDGTPDECEADCDDDGVPDECEDDLNGNGVPDDCEIGGSYCGPAVPNSSGLPGLISASGSDVAADDDLTLYATQLPVNKPGYFLVSPNQGFIPNPGGSQGNLCLAAPIGRYRQQIQSSGPDGTFSIAIDLNVVPPNDSVVMPGETWNWTTWFRDTNPGQTSNFTDGLSVTFQ